MRPEERANRKFKIVSDSAYLKGKYGENLVVHIEGTDKDVMGKPWFLNSMGNPAIGLYTIRQLEEDITPYNGPVYYGKINGLGELIHESELGEEVTN